MKLGALPELRMTWRGARAALAVGLLTLTIPPPVDAQEPGATQSAALASQKAKVLEAYLDSNRVATAEAEDPEQAGQSIAEARAKLANGRVALEGGQISQAIADFDAGMRAVSRAVAATPIGSTRNAPASSYRTRRAQVASYLATIPQTGDVSSVDAARKEELNAALDQADALAAAGRSEEAIAAIGVVYTDVVRFVSDLQRGHTLIVRREFETAADEYAYERERNRSYQMLVQIAVAERGADQPGLEAMAAKLSEMSDHLKAEAETLAKVGEHPTAIKLMEQATGRLAAALRASGVLVME